MKEIPLTKGLVAIVDDEDYQILCQYKWCVQGRPKRTISYAVRALRGEYPNHITMHAQVMRTPAGMSTHHINGNGLDNQRTNLVVVTPSDHRIIHRDTMRRKENPKLPKPTVVRDYFNLQEVGDQLGITRERVRQIATKRNIGIHIDGRWHFSIDDINRIRQQRKIWRNSETGQLWLARNPHCVTMGDVV
jgi:hypothetical protein